MTKTVIHWVFEQVVERCGGQTAIIETGREICYSALNEAANRVAHGLLERHTMRKGDVVGLRLPMGIDYVTALLGVAKAGGVFLPLDLEAPPNRQAKILETGAPTIVIGESAGAVDHTALQIPLAQFADDNSDNLPLTVDGEDGSYIVFTSGSTGVPKAILGGQKGLSHFIDWEVKEFDLDEVTRVSQLSPPTFDVCLRDIFAPLLAGGILCIPPAGSRTNSLHLLNWLEDARISLMHCVPSLFRQLTAELEAIARPENRLRNLQNILLAGEPLYGVDVQRWRDLIGYRVELVNLYGPSETTLAKAFHRINETPVEPNRMVPVGKPLPGAALLILKDGQLCDRSEIGEIFIKTPFMTKGYLGESSLMDEVFVQNPLNPEVPDLIYRSGDLGRYLESHVVELLGRKDGQVKINGVRIETAELESALLQHPQIEQAIVVAHLSQKREHYLTAYFIAGETLVAADLREFLQDWLPLTMQPSFYVQMESFPLNLHGKINRRALPPPADLLYQHAPYVAPASEAEETLAGLWGEILDLGKVGVTHSFVDLGGDSLKAIHVLSRVYQQFHVEVKLQELFPQGSVRGLAALVTAHSQPRDARPAGSSPKFDV